VSFVHYKYVGHFDPHDAVDLSQRPYMPRLQRPIPRDAFERAVDEIGEGVEEFLEYVPSGYVVCHWSSAGARLFDRVRRFAVELARTEGGVVMSEMFLIEYPEEARLAQEALWATRGT
jgi:hypothetical protein